MADYEIFELGDVVLGGATDPTDLQLTLLDILPFDLASLTLGACQSSEGRHHPDHEEDEEQRRTERDDHDVQYACEHRV